MIYRESSGSWLNVAVSLVLTTLVIGAALGFAFA